MVDYASFASLSAAVFWFAAQCVIAFLLTALFFLIALPQKVGERLIGLHFDSRLAQLKADQDGKLEQLRAQLQHWGDRGKHSNEQEFRAVGETWQLFVDAFMATSACAVGLFSQPDLDNSSEEEVEAFLSASDLSEVQKSWVRLSHDKNRTYANIEIARSINRAGQLIFDGRLALRKNSIFMNDKTRQTFTDAFNNLGRVQTQRFIEQRRSESSAVRHVEDFLLNGEVMFSSVMACARERMLHESRE